MSVATAQYTVVIDDGPSTREIWSGARLLRARQHAFDRALQDGVTTCVLRNGDQKVVVYEAQRDQYQQVTITTVWHDPSF